MDDDAQKLDATTKATSLVAKRFDKDDVVTGLKRSFKHLGRAIANGIALYPAGSESIASVIDSVLEIPAEFVEGMRPESRAWTLVHRAAGQAILELMAPVVEMHPEIQDDYGKELGRLPNVNLKDAEFEIAVDFFDQPVALPIAQAIKRTFESWLRDIHLPTIEVRTVVGRFDSFWAAALHDEWRRHAEAYKPVLEALSSPFARADQIERAWARHRLELIKLRETPIFGETFSLKDIYVRLRAAYKQDEKSATVVDLHSAVQSWLEKPDKDHAVMLVRGGPGSGKSSFTRMLASELAEQNVVRVVHVPLQRSLIIKERLGQSLDQYLGEWCASAHFPMRMFTDWNPASASRRYLLIFDGLDEFGGEEREAARDAERLLDRIHDQLEIWNQSRCLVQALVTGRPAVIQAVAKTASPKGPRNLEVLRYYYRVGSAERNVLNDPHGLLTGTSADQREDWWRRYTALKPKADGAARRRLLDSRLDSLSSEPLLLYLLVLSGYHNQEIARERTNLNGVYRLLFTQVSKGMHGGGRRKTRIELGEDFDEIMETLALAAWYGNGRTATIRQAVALCSTNELGEKINTFMDESGQALRLLAASYMHSVESIGRNPAFEFTHRSFREYLTARRLVREIDTIFKSSGDGKDQDLLRMGLKKWLRMCGLQPVTREIVAFLRDEIRWRHAQQPETNKIINWKTTLEMLFKLNLDEGMPAFDGARSYRQAVARALNAEEALLAAINACALATESVWTLDWGDDPCAAAKLIGRLRRGLAAVAMPLSLTLLGGMPLARQGLWCVDLGGADLRRADFQHADLRRADLRRAKLGLANLRRANLRRANLVGANLVGANLRRANLGNVNLGGANLRDAKLYCADLRRANLEGANLGHANLVGASLDGADLRRANLDGVRLTKKQRAEAIFD
ncbi:MAG: pentapeptide repeat-containing protein [Rhodospirillaceae bacterium]|nr:pentapeptide repeat-containing protein [Rhodospirillaceae bacterium]